MIHLLAQEIRELESFGQVDYANHTTIHPVGFTLLAICCIAVFVLPRRYAAVPLLLMAALIPAAQRVVILGLDFTYLRILILCATFRILAFGENAGLRWGRIDTLMTSWALALFAVVNVRTGMSALVYQCGITMDALGAYFVFRALVRTWPDVAVLARTAAYLSVPLALAFWYEQSTQRNLFHMFGGVPEITAVREDRLRCGGPYNHPILAGCFWASLLPLCAARWWSRDGGALGAVVATGCGLVIIYTCASSTPLLGVIVGVIGGAAFFLRHKMRVIRWGILLLLIGLHLVMKAPVWHLVSRVSAVGGSTGYHRFMLIDTFIRRFTEWAPLGVNSTAHWFFGGQDVTNHFILQGVNGGVVVFILFVWLVCAAFAAVGRAWRSVQHDRAHLALAWALGVSLMVHCACFIGVSYFGQIVTLWYMTLGIIASLAPAAQPKAAGARAGERAPQPPQNVSWGVGRSS